MTTITPDEMKSLETLFMSETGTPSILLMEHAAQPQQFPATHRNPPVCSSSAVPAITAATAMRRRGFGAQAAVSQTYGK